MVNTVELQEALDKLVEQHGVAMATLIITHDDGAVTQITGNGQIRPINPEIYPWSGYEPEGNESPESDLA